MCSPPWTFVEQDYSFLLAVFFILLRQSIFDLNVISVERDSSFMYDLNRASLFFIAYLQVALSRNALRMNSAEFVVSGCFSEYGG